MVPQQWAQATTLRDTGELYNRQETRTVCMHTCLEEDRGETVPCCCCCQHGDMARCAHVVIVIRCQYGATVAVLGVIRRAIGGGQLEAS